MIKKLFLPTAVIGATLLFGNSAHEAKADEVNQAKLVDLANNHQEELNSKPVQAGAYNIDFVNNGQSYHFESNGSTWSWSVGGEATSNTTEAVKAPEQKVDQQQVQFNTQSKQNAQPKQETTTQS
ncbi:transglycosylase family protein [Staphylococcus phage vB_SsapH-Golestan-100]|nr:transglycosylase family protein [Staphylococcus phage vB_SsapH-Golestan-100]